MAFNKIGYTRNGLDWTKRFSVIAGALDIPGQAIIDGEVVVIHEGRTNFSELQAELAAGRQDRLVFYAFERAGALLCRRVADHLNDIRLFRPVTIYTACQPPH
jgi:hypothetical protein